MSYKETLYFIAKCLTISFELKNRQQIEAQLKSNKLDWNSIVQVSTSHYVFPALYCNLKNQNFLKYLPNDLIKYMVYITNLNSQRNLQIIAQAKEINKILLANNITPIFLKGTANLLANLYVNIAERMVGDIDFILSKEDFDKAILVLRSNGYFDVGKYDYHFPAQKHYRRLKKKNNIASIEIHQELLLEKYQKEFNYNFVKKNSQVINNLNVLSFDNKLNLSIIAFQINDAGFYYNNISLRNAYDVFLLSKKTNSGNAINSLKKLKHPLNCFLAVCFEIFNKVDSLQYYESKKTSLYVKNFNLQFENVKTTIFKHRIIKFYLFFKVLLNILIKSILYKDCRIWLIKRLTDINRYKYNHETN